MYEKRFGIGDLGNWGFGESKIQGIRYFRNQELGDSGNWGIRELGVQ